MKEKIKQLIRFRELKTLYDKYERLLMPGTLVVGVIVDVVTFQSIQIEIAFLILGIYAVIAGAAIAFIHLFDANKLEGRFFLIRYVRLTSPLIVQFTFGALLSASLIFYWFSGAFSVSWPFFLIVAILMASNDVLRHYYERAVVQISVYFFILFSIIALILPFIVNAIDLWVFVVSGLVSVCIIMIYTGVLARFVRTIQAQRFQIAFIVVFIFILMILSYVANVIPPIPLSIREAGVYHSVQPLYGGGYLLHDEDETILDQISPGERIHIAPGGRVFVYTAIFAPVDLRIRIVHHWQYYDESTRRWISKDRLSFSVAGGRNEGYRGFSMKTNVQPGIWRVDVETERRQVLGRIHIRVEEVAVRPELIEIVK